MLYFDTTFLARLYLQDAGYEAVRALAAEQQICSAWHAQAEIRCAFHRAMREGRLQRDQYDAQLAQFEVDDAAGAFRWLPLSSATLQRLAQVLAAAPASAYLRAADALHLACAAENDCAEIYSNDRHLLAAAPLFGVRGANIVSQA